MSETWKQWEGRTVDGRFPLQSYLGGSDHGAVFLTESGEGDSGKAAIKLIAAEAADAEKRLLRWEVTRDLDHPNLIRIFEAGLCELDGTKLLYVVEEYAEENLSQILPERALTVEEARIMLPPILRALQYVHGKRYGHGHIQPSNILAIGDQVKLSSDTLSELGEKSRAARVMSAYDPPEAATGASSAAADVWQLGTTLVEALTQHLPVWDRARPSAPEIPPAVSEPFREIGRHCLRLDAGQRWTVAEIIGRLETDRLEADRLETDRLATERPATASAQAAKAGFAPAIPGNQKASRTWSYLLGLAAVVAIAFVLIPRPKPPGATSGVQSTEAQSTQAKPGATATSSQSVQTPTQTEPKPSPTAAKRATPAARGDEGASPKADNESGVARRVMPQVAPSARRTIEGTIKVRVKVDVDAGGNVAKATLESGGPSKYFSRIALEAARDWKFSPAHADESGVREWKLQFAFSRAKTEVSAVRAKR
jgi:TonB family protein